MRQRQTSPDCAQRWWYLPAPATPGGGCSLIEVGRSLHAVACTFAKRLKHNTFQLVVRHTATEFRSIKAYFLMLWPREPCTLG